MSEPKILEVDIEPEESVLLKVNGRDLNQCRSGGSAAGATMYFCGL